MNITYSDDVRFHAAMKGNYNLEDVIEYITKNFRPDEIYTDLELHEWLEDTNDT